jgi:F0F1-type ATP synthase assembly protein I
MTASTNQNGANGRHWPSPVPCPALPFEQPIDAIGPQTIEAEEDIDALEAAALMDAFDQGNASLRASLPRIDDAAGQAEADFQSAGGAIDALDRLRDTRSVEEAADLHAKVLKRHADDGPEDRRRRGFFKPWMVWVVLVAAAVFDASFVGNLTQRILGVGPHSLIYYLAYLPGIGMALCLLAAGTFLAENLYRRRMWISRRRRREPLTPWRVLRRTLWWWREQPQIREPDDLPWYRVAVPMICAVATTGLLGVIAYIRALRAGAQFAALRELQPVFVILLLLLSIAAIALKVLSHNPCADSAEEAQKGLERMSKRVERDTATARSAVTNAVKSANHLNTLIVNAESDARSTVERACARLLAERGHRNRAGEIVLPLVYLRWPAGIGTPAGQTELPGLSLALLDGARRESDEYRPDVLSNRLAATVGEIHQQFHPANDGRHGASP